MQKLTLNLRNCYGIEKLNCEFDYSQKSVNLLYARNGLMKTSLTKTFKKLQENKEDEICDEVFSKEPVVSDIKIDDNAINPENIFVIKSYESAYESDGIASLLVDTNVKEQLNTLLVIKEKFLKKLERYSGLKVKKTSGRKSIFELEDQLIDDLNIEEYSLLTGLSEISVEEIEYDFSKVMYAPIFASGLEEKIKSNDFQSKIDEFIEKTYEIYADYTFLEKGNFTLPKLKKIEKELRNNSFFVNGNKVLLSGNSEIEDVNLLKEKIDEIDSRLQETREFKEIEKILSTAKGIVLKDVIENNPEIIQELKVDKFDELKKKLWLSYIKAEAYEFVNLRNCYREFEEVIEQLGTNHTPWQKALDIFNNRFTVPFKMEIGNLKSSIIGESVPKVLFSFCKDGNIENLNDDNWVKINRDDLEEKNTLSQGERRALYLLNIIFDIENRKISENDTLFIVDDIADSFDYKNKYAIIEYLKEIAEFPRFYMLVLSHNFDFYRTLSSRLDVARENKYMVYKNGNEIVVEQEHYQKRPFTNWINSLTNKNVVALIPYVRNLIEFGIDKKVNDFPNIDSDELFLTNLVHMKDYTEAITMGDLKKVFKAYIGKDNFIENSDDSVKVYKIIEDVSNDISYTDIKLENKIALSIGSRLKAEKHMLDKITQANIQMPVINSNQTRRLYELYCPIGNNSSNKILDKVNIMTPESIHLNSFMYEPIIDMDIIELKSLYDQIRNLQL
ncbi:MAG: hypothetical protein JXQ26_07960 [Tissierellales bacterium]|nr:hypothetical protein [Tissierellales bacterium]MBN2827909.1 hypothetical protein [Tissierellales bacterium]